MQETANSSDRDTENPESTGNAETGNTEIGKEESRPGEDHPIVLFDAECLLCDRSVRFVLVRDHAAHFHFAPLQSTLGKELLERHGLPQDSMDGVVLIERGVAHTKSSASLRVARRLTFPWRAGVLLLVIPKFLRDAVYRLIARNRYRWFGRREACMIPDARWKDRFHE